MNVQNKRRSHWYARYELGVFTEELPRLIAVVLEFIFNFIVVFAYIPFILFFIWLIKIFTWPAALVLCLMGMAAIILLTPYRMDLKDPVNDLVLRIQSKKNKGLNS